MAVYSEKEISELVSAARASVELSVRSPKFDAALIESQFGHIKSAGSIVVRLIDYPTNTVYGTSEIIETNVVKAVVTAALSAAFDADKLAIPPQRVNEIIVELNFLQDPKRISGSFINKLKEVDVGKHGLMVSYGAHRSILLPSYPVEHGMDKTRFLQAACEAARLPSDYWKQPSISIYKFDVERYIEEEPNGKIKRL